ncbi:hypothetical protein TUBRATIS_001880 [Tubulinosema ratisbonensis]|uniref:Uncharacterized protein n=1 Tax=Tubulinosema ratisbonensis TaxID=291195 RepID=A0A437APW5_9MICR|nr:hypothetical protein TUBRATIS_001880 [Tubulinosema ratisbonensis]
MLIFTLCSFVLSTKEMLFDWINLIYFGSQDEQNLAINRLEAYKIYIQSFHFTEEWAQIIKDKFPEMTSSQAEQMESQEFKNNVLILTELLCDILTRAEVLDSLLETSDSHDMKASTFELNSNDFKKIVRLFANESFKEVLIPLTAKFSDPNNFSSDPEQEDLFFKKFFRDLGLNDVSVYIKSFVAEEEVETNSTSNENVCEAESASFLPAENPSLGD